jgi:hypothetical protein
MPSGDHGRVLLRRHWQVAPFTANDVGALFVPEWLPLKPMSALWPGASVEFHDAPAAVTAEPDWLHVALQPCWTV